MRPRLRTLAQLAASLFATGCGHSSPSGSTCTNACADGFAPDGSCACTPVLPASPCAENEIAVPGDTACRAVGVIACVDGFVADGQGGCVPVLPPQPCAAGQMAIPGETACRAVADCGSDPFGDMPLEAATTYVLQGYTGGGSDGTRAHPFLTIQDAVSRAPVGGMVAIGAGTYVEDVVAAHEVRIWGCPSRVTLQGGPDPAIAALQLRSGGEVHGMTITGPGYGLVMAHKVLIDHVWVRDFGNYALGTQPGADVTVTDSLMESSGHYLAMAFGGSLSVQRSVFRGVKESAGYASAGVGGMPSGGKYPKVTITKSVIERNAGTGVHIEGGTLDIDSSVIRDGVEIGLANASNGVDVEFAADGTPSNLSMTASVVQRNPVLGVFIVGSTATIDGSTIVDQFASAVGQFGNGIYVSDGSGKGSTLTLTGSLVARNSYLGIGAFSSTVDVGGSIVRDTRVEPSDGVAGEGLYEGPDSATHLPSVLTVHDCLIRGNRLAGVVGESGQISIDKSVVRENVPGPAGAGCGVILEQSVLVTKADGTLSVSGSVIESNTQAGLWLYGATGTVTGSVVRGSLPNGNGQYGDGLVVQSYAAYPGAISVVSSEIRDNGRAGVFAWGASLELSGTRVECNALDIDVEQGDGSPPSVADDGGNACGCGAGEVCHASSSGLTAAPPPPKS